MFKKTGENESNTWKGVGLAGVIIGLALVVVIVIWVVQTRNYNSKLYSSYSDTGKYMIYNQDGTGTFEKENYSKLEFPKSYATGDYRQKKIGNMSEINIYEKFWNYLLHDGSNAIYEVENESGHKILNDGTSLYGKTDEIAVIKDYYSKLNNCSYQIHIDNISSGESKVQVLELDRDSILKNLEESETEEGELKETNQGYNYFLTIVSNDGVYGIQRSILIEGENCYMGTDKFAEGDSGSETSGREYFIKLDGGVSEAIIEFVSSVAWG